MSDWPDRSTARGALWWALWDNYSGAQKNEFINAFAHELAEQIRNEVSEMGFSGMAADLIDPEVDNA